MQVSKYIIMQPVGEICNQYGNFSYSSLRAGPVRCKHRLVTDRQNRKVGAGQLIMGPLCLWQCLSFGVIFRPLRPK